MQGAQNVAATIDVVEAELRSIEKELAALPERAPKGSPREGESLEERKKDLRQQRKKQEALLSQLRWENAKTSIVAVLILALIYVGLVMADYV
jgi:hypothetical protein